MVDIIQFDPRDILQVDVTVIAGILVLLTITGVMEARLDKKLWEELRGLIGITPIFFASSGVILLSPTLVPWFDTNEVIRWSKILLIIGLAYITLAIGYIMIISKPKQDNKKSNPNFYHDG